MVTTFAIISVVIEFSEVEETELSERAYFDKS